MSTLRIVAREFDGFERSFKAQGDAFRAANPGVTVQVDFLPIEDLHRLMIEEAGGKSDRYDLFLCVTDWLPEAIQEGLIDPLDSFLAQNPPPDWPEGWSASMRGLQTYEGSCYGLAYHDGPEVLMVRGDLIESEVEQRRFKTEFGRDLTPPKDWDEFVEVAKFFTRPEENVWGACLAGYPDAHNNVYDFMTQLWSRGGRLLDTHNGPCFDSETGVEAASFLRDLFHTHKVVSLDCLEMDSVKSGIWYAQGNAAMMWNWAGFAAVAELPDTSKIVGKNRCYGMPKGPGKYGRAVSLNIYWVLAITSGCKQKQLAYEFLRHVGSPAMDKITSMLGGNGTRLSTWRDSEIQERYPYYRIIEEVHGTVESPPPIPAFPQLAELLNVAMSDILNLRSEPSIALREAATRARDVLRSSVPV